MILRRGLSKVIECDHVMVEIVRHEHRSHSSDPIRRTHLDSASGSHNRFASFPNRECHAIQPRISSAGLLDSSLVAHSGLVLYMVAIEEQRRRTFVASQR